MTYADLLNQALLLSESERVSFAQNLLESVGVAAPPLSDAWLEEIERRMNELDEGRVELLDYDKVIREAEQVHPQPPTS